MVVGKVYNADSRRSHDLCELRRSAVQSNLAGMIRQSALAIDQNQIRCTESGGEQTQRIVQEVFVGRINCPCHDLEDSSRKYLRHSNGMAVIRHLDANNSTFLKARILESAASKVTTRVKTAANEESKPTGPTQDLERKVLGVPRSLQAFD